MKDALLEIQEQPHQRNVRRALGNPTYIPDVPQAGEEKRLLWQELRKYMAMLEEDVCDIVNWLRLQCAQERRVKGETEEELEHG